MYSWHRLLALWLLPSCLALEAQNRPNIVFILTDDQDAHMTKLDQHMPLVYEHLLQKGTHFTSHFCTVAICCPSRVNLWTGQAAHNTNVTDVHPPWGGYPKFVENGYNQHHLALWMQQSGYNTYYTGKLFNSHTVQNYDSPHVTGFNGSEFLLDPFTYQYYNVTTTRNGQPPVNVVGKYSPDLIAESTYGFLEEALRDKSRPFFITAAPIAPHNWMSGWPKKISAPPEYALRHSHMFRDYKIPRTANFNPKSPSGVGWISKLELLNDTVIEYNDEFQRARLRALQSVDEMVGSLLQRLEEANVLDNTYIFYTSDNGYHISQYRMHPGKECGFDTDINVPLVVRGPGIPADVARTFPTSHTNVAPTIMQLAGNSIHDRRFDGAPIELFQEPAAPSEHVSIEFWGRGLPEGHFAFVDEQESSIYLYPNNTYKGLRIEAESYSLYYSVWCTNETELYDIKNDPGQLNNILQDKNNTKIASLFGRNVGAIVDRLDALVMVLKSCKEETCIDPWKSLHSNGLVGSLPQALEARYDEFYAKQLKVSFSKCEMGYIKSSEGPQDIVAYDSEEPSGVKYMYDADLQNPVLVDARWSEWT